MGKPVVFRLRAEVHAYLDPIWQQAAYTGGYTPKEVREFTGPKAYYFEQSARCRVYAWLAEQMGMTRDECHASLFTARQCRRAIAILSGVTFADIRPWAQRKRLKIYRWYDTQPAHQGAA